MSKRHYVLQDDIDHCSLALDFTVDNEKRLGAESGAVFRVNFRPDHNVEEAVLVLERDEMVPFRRGRRLVNDGKPGDAHQRSTWTSSHLAA